MAGLLDFIDDDDDPTHAINSPLLKATERVPLLDFIGAPTGLLGSRDSSPWTDGLLPRKRIAEPAPWYMAEWIPEGIRRSAAELAAQNAVLPEALRWPRSEREIPFVPLLDLSGVPKLGETAGTTGDRAADTQSFASRWPSPPMYDPSRTSRDAGIGLNAFVPRAHANWRDAAAMFTPSAAFSQNVEYAQGDSSSHANAGANRYRHTARDVAPVQVLPDSFDVEYTQQSLTPDEASQWLNAAQNPEYFDGPDGASVAMSDRVTRIGNGGTVSNGKVLTVTPQGNVLTTVTRDTAVSIDSRGRIRVIRLQRT